MTISYKNQTTYVLGLEKGPSFARRKEWRFILRRICEFLRSVDYLIQELVHRVVKTSVRLLHEYVEKSSEILKDSRQKKISNRPFELYLSNLISLSL